jgi:hypothetical protein
MFKSIKKFKIWKSSDSTNVQIQKSVKNSKNFQIWKMFDNLKCSDFKNLKIPKCLMLENVQNLKIFKI